MHTGNHISPAGIGPAEAGRKSTISSSHQIRPKMAQPDRINGVRRQEPLI